MSTFKGLLITKDQEWIDQLQTLLDEIKIDLTVVSEWKRSFQEQQHYHYIFVDLRTVEESQAFQTFSTSVLIGLTDTHDFEQGRTWLVAGAKDIIVFPEEQHRLIDLIKVMNQKITFQKETEAGYGTGQVHAFYSAKGEVVKHFLLLWLPND